VDYVCTSRYPGLFFMNDCGREKLYLSIPEDSPFSFHFSLINQYDLNSSGSCNTNYGSPLLIQWEQVVVYSVASQEAFCLPRLCTVVQVFMVYCLPTGMSWGRNLNPSVLFSFVLILRSYGKYVLAIILSFLFFLGRLSWWVSWHTGAWRLRVQFPLKLLPR